MPKRPWWGDFSLAEHQNLCWSIGAREIGIERLKSEWRTWNLNQPEENITTITVTEREQAITSIDNSLKKDCLGRHLQESTSDQISILPSLADRSMVARPATPLRILVGEKATIYLSTPLWFTAYIGKNRDCLLDIPFYRPSDSWFGPSPREGDICYAKYTDARLELGNLERSQHRAITPICVINKHKEAIIIERISIPVPLLTLYSDEKFQLWTNALTITHDADNATALLVLGKQAPDEAQDSVLLNTARVIAGKNTFVRSISSLFA